MTKNEVINVIKDHLEIATDTNVNLQVVSVGNDEYKVYALCSDGLVEIKPKKNANKTF